VLSRPCGSRKVEDASNLSSSITSTRRPACSHRAAPFQLDLTATTTAVRLCACARRSCLQRGCEFLIPREECSTHASYVSSPKSIVHILRAVSFPHHNRGVHTEVQNLNQRILSGSSHALQVRIETIFSLEPFLDGEPHPKMHFFCCLLFFLQPTWGPFPARAKRQSTCT